MGWRAAAGLAQLGGARADVVVELRRILGDHRRAVVAFEVGGGVRALDPGDAFVPVATRVTEDAEGEPARGQRVVFRLKVRRLLGLVLLVADPGQSRHALGPEQVEVPAELGVEDGPRVSRPDRVHLEAKGRPAPRGFVDERRVVAGDANAPVVEDDPVDGDLHVQIGDNLPDGERPLVLEMVDERGEPGDLVPRLVVGVGARVGARLTHRRPPAAGRRPLWVPVRSSLRCRTAAAVGRRPRRLVSTLLDIRVRWASARIRLSDRPRERGDRRLTAHVAGRSQPSEGASRPRRSDTPF